MMLSQDDDGNNTFPVKNESVTITLAILLLKRNFKKCKNDKDIKEYHKNILAEIKKLKESGIINENCRGIRSTVGKDV